MSESSEGEVITFYSYKGGTGRTMALANIAWILASNGKRVLAVDWDLESPGLHKYFHPFLDESVVGTTPGVIEIINGYASAGWTLRRVLKTGIWNMLGSTGTLFRSSGASPARASWTSFLRAARTATIPRRSRPLTGTTSMTGSEAGDSSAQCGRI
jgi:hypothetical protein